ncbi:hypothetical protein Rs2_44969 [Raphanus sativus]|nr:hypothetical protein Rs2_44969 [Raphanus sativus]
MKTSMSTIVFLLVVLSISAISLANQSPLEACIRKNISPSLSPPSNKPETSNFEVSDELCKEETRNITSFLKLNGKFPPYYVKALCNVFGSDQKKVKAYITYKLLNRLKELLNSLTCVKRTMMVIKDKSPVETCIRRNIAQSLSPSPSNSLITSHNDVMEDQLCRDETRVIMYFLKKNRKFPTYYVEALCNVFGDDEKEVKEYIITKLLNHLKKLIDSLACASL